MLESAPDYLPVHWRIGQILLERNNIPAAMEKYKLIADTYLIRGDNERAAEILHEAIKLAPMDTSLHQSLIKLLQAEENWDALLNQYIDMADAYYQLGELDQARSTYQQAIQLAEQTGIELEELTAFSDHQSTQSIKKYASKINQVQDRISNIIAN